MQSETIKLYMSGSPHAPSQAFYGATHSFGLCARSVIHRILVLAHGDSIKYREQHNGRA